MSPCGGGVRFGSGGDRVLRGAGGGGFGRRERRWWAPVERCLLGVGGSPRSYIFSLRFARVFDGRL